MRDRDYRDVVGGGLLVIGGSLFAWYAYARYDVGTLRQMGSGMFPTALGVTLAIFGALIAIPALLRPGEAPVIRVWSPLFVLGGVAAFAAMINPFGLIPAILSVVIVSSFAELKIRPVSLLMLSIALCVVAWLTFRVGLGLSLALWNWPF